VVYLSVDHLSPMHVRTKYCTELTCISEIHSNIMYCHIRAHSMYTGKGRREIHMDIPSAVVVIREIMEYKIFIIALHL